MRLAPLNPILKVLLIGVYDKESDLYVLRGIPHLVRHIWRLVLKCLNYWKSCIKVGQPIQYKNVDRRQSRIVDNLGYFIPNIDKDMGYKKEYENVNTVKFIAPIGININMMPFKASHRFEDSYLPDTKHYRYYWNEMIRPCLNIQPESKDKIWYLTIQESFVEENASQRRPGIHTETPGVILLHTDVEQEDKLGDVTDMKKGAGLSKCVSQYVVGKWGEGYYYSHDQPKGGIFMASNVEDSCKIWNCRIIADNSGNEIIGEHGDISHLRQFLPEGEVLKKNTMYWFTDRTPHESLPLEKGIYRQFFRLVSNIVTVWFKDHSTPNPNGLLPDPTITKIVSGSKFDKTEKLVIVN